MYNKTSLSKYSSSIPIADWSDPSQTTGLHGAVHQVGQHRLFSTRGSHKLSTVSARRRFSTYSTAGNPPITFTDIVAPRMSQSKQSNPSEQHQTV